MAAESVKPKDKMLDEGLERGVANLTEERIQKVIQRVIGGETGARLKAYVDTCIHCGLCSDACHFFLSRDRDHHPVPLRPAGHTALSGCVEKTARASSRHPSRAQAATQGASSTRPFPPAAPTSDISHRVGFLPNKSAKFCHFPTPQHYA